MKNYLLLLPFVFVFQVCNAQLPWKKVLNQKAGNAYSLASTNNGYVYAFSNGQFYRSKSNGDPGTFQLVNTIPSGLGNSHVYANGDFVYLLNFDGGQHSGIWRSADYGDTWVQNKDDFKQSDLAHFLGMVFADGGSMILYVHGAQNYDVFYVSTNYGRTWDIRHSLPGTASKSISIIRKNSRLYLFHWGDMFYSDDNGVNWTQQNCNCHFGSIDRTVVLSNGNFIQKTGFEVLESRNNGITWQTQTNTGLPQGWTHAANLKKSPSSDTIYTDISNGSKMHIFSSADSGKSWTVFDAGLDTSFSDCNRWEYGNQLHLANNGYLFVAPYPAGEVYRTSAPVTKPFKIIPDTPSSIYDAYSAALQVNLYPNPVEDVLNVSFVQKQYGRARISVYNLVGKEVLSIAMPASKGTRVHNTSTKLLPSGIYLIKVITPNGRAIRKFAVK